jgi:hypothetical protein
VSRSSGELDSRTRTLYVECDVDNSHGLLVPGSFVYLTVHVPIKSLPRVPVTALVMRGEKAFVAKVDDGGQVHFQPVTISRTDGSTATLADGLAVGERVATNLPGEVTEGGRIQPVQVASKSE